MLVVSRVDGEETEVTAEPAEALSRSIPFALRMFSLPLLL